LVRIPAQSHCPTGSRYFALFGSLLLRKDRE